MNGFIPLVLAFAIQEPSEARWVLPRGEIEVGEALDSWLLSPAGSVPDGAARIVVRISEGGWVWMREVGHACGTPDEGSSAAEIALRAVAYVCVAAPEPGQHRLVAEYVDDSGLTVHAVESSEMAFVEAPDSWPVWLFPAGTAILGYLASIFQTFANGRIEAWRASREERTAARARAAEWIAEDKHQNALILARWRPGSLPSDTLVVGGLNALLNDPTVVGYLEELGRGEVEDIRSLSRRMSQFNRAARQQDQAAVDRLGRELLEELSGGGAK